MPSASASAEHIHVNCASSSHAPLPDHSVALATSLDPSKVHSILEVLTFCPPRSSKDSLLLAGLLTISLYFKASPVLHVRGGGGGGPFSRDG